MRLTQVRADFRHWRRTRPFWAGLWVMAGGCFIVAPPIAPVEIMLTAGPAGTTALGVGVVLFAAGVVFWTRPQQRVFTAVVSAAFSVVSFATTNFGGLGIGMLLGVLGSSMAFGWRATPAAEGPGSGHPREGGRGTEHPGQPAAEDPTADVSEDGQRTDADGDSHPVPAAPRADDTARSDATANRVAAPILRKPGLRRRVGSRRTPRRLLRGGVLACAALQLSLMTAGPAHAQSCLPDGVPWLLPWPPAPPPCSDPSPEPSPSDEPAPAPSTTPGSGPSGAAPAPSSPSGVEPLPSKPAGVHQTAVPPAPEEDTDLPLPARIPPDISAAKLDAHALEIKGSRTLPTTDGAVKVLVMHAASVSLRDYRLDTAQPGPGLGVGFDITIHDVDLYLSSLSGTLRVAGVPIRLALSADLLPDFLPLNVPLPQLTLESVKAQQTLIVSPRAEYSGLRITTRSGG
ncbi:DUF6114 domain-containing protein [Streptomyces sp. UG1]|uniref:DUF6114 domain-containing protein n=1 Tax=Streptomyces sp. UG1 TaxID=3417652 RepID=UPI003CEF3D87